MIVRREQDGDRAAIRAVVIAAFGRADEACLVDDLRSEGDLSVSLVAEIDGSIAGHVALSRLRSPARAVALAPLSVRPDVQRCGIGGALVKAALAEASITDVRTVFVLGDPDYYGRFGFKSSAAAGYASTFAGPHFMALKLGLAADPAAEERGQVVYAPAFDRLT